ncbi:FAD-binding oxidoreductase [Lichenihabitans sp. Uapishka_5]|uniref:NAD(P)/FAD-dependent oxidoreductase n=1 Tax=Lichenihabitans sp. Uapishka_5 TaxID=3037302 RepID=UPI0029E8171F|nr:FAD-binding oxidoreductase [Lichenihabitans sp. Uapishka_5]MDX7953704.1 FAD-binding oxidoreductase [Lichenihabitans sp. Uapishka_5]
MPTQSPALRVVVIGGGIFGVSSALQLARRGADVTLVTEGSFAAGASGRSLSWLNSSRRRSLPYHHLRMAGIDRYRTLAARHPGLPWLRFDGGLTWDAEDGTNEIAAAYAYERSLGYDSTWLQADEIAAATPGVDPRTVTSPGAIFNPGEGWVDLPSLIRHLLPAFEAHGGHMVAEAGPARVETANGRVTGVVAAEAGRFEADAVLVAAGPATPKLVAGNGITIPDATPVSLLLETEPVETQLRAVLNTPRVAMRPTPRGTLVLDSAWSEEEVVTRPDGSHEVRQSTLDGLLAEASKVLAGNPALRLARYGVGPKPIPLDGEPVFGAVAGIAGYHVAFSHSGATLGLIAGELLAEEIVTGAPHPMLAPFRAARFG